MALRAVDFHYPAAQKSDRVFLSKETEYYFERFGFCAPQISVAPHPDLGIIVVIPCYNERGLLTSLESLWNCARPDCAVEIVVVVNSAESSVAQVLDQNTRTLREAREWIG